MKFFYGSMKCLIIDDDAVMCELISDYARSTNLFTKVESNTDAISALSQINKESYDVLVFGYRDAQGRRSRNT